MTQLSAPIRILALVGLLASAAMGVWMMTAGGTAGSRSADKAAPVVPLESRAKSVAHRVDAHARATAAGRPDTVRAGANTKRPARVDSHKRLRVTPAQAANAPKAQHGTPTSVAAALAAHQIVVVLLFDPQASVDAYSVAEARVGAREAGAGFLPVSVLDSHSVSPFATAYGVLQDPTLLFFKKPGKLALKLTGFADHETVAQAVENAARGLGTVQRP